MSKVYACLYLIFHLMRKDVVNAITCDEEDTRDIVTKIRLKVYQGNSSHFTSTESTVTNPGNIADAILTDRDSILYIHGFMENTEAENVRVIIRAYLDKGDVNVILLDWGDIAYHINYVYVASQVAAIGKVVAESLNQLIELIDLDTLHVIGHSLGAHIAGNIGRFANISRITGLDPAFPLFYPSACHIRSTDAEAVVILHTDGGFYGAAINTGTVDFYANKGISVQPGCPIIFGAELCSHQRSVAIYAESLNSPKAFPAHKCFDKIADIEEVYFGDSTPKNIYGAYCFNTNAKSPYGKGV
ncbi:phospholipase A1 1-like isoform X1 [Frieseomelitta varia]|uniref:phospholipase A1 1-like isoform X1 n=1 Tax=Frieseomelitta varia TaxID=561572 RepID=UPI001CB68A7B|nr:phospholipase A1 1-like isoform X1 [Frieseomelitta varia]